MASGARYQIRPGMLVRTIAGEELGKVVRVAPCVDAVGCGYFTPWQLEPCPVLVMEVEPAMPGSGEAGYLPLEAVRDVKGQVVVVAGSAEDQLWRCPGQRVLRRPGNP